MINAIVSFARDMQISFFLIQLKQKESFLKSLLANGDITHETYSRRHTENLEHFAAAIEASVTGVSNDKIRNA